MERYETKAFGFPVVILNPKWKTKLGQKVLNLNLSSVAKELFPLVLRKEGRLTGGEIKFVRTFLEMNQTDFAKSIGLADHSPISRWEKNPDRVTGMNPAQEFTLRVISLKLGGYRVKNEIAEIFEIFKERKESGKTIELPSEDIVA